MSLHCSMESSLPTPICFLHEGCRWMSAKISEWVFLMGGLVKMSSNRLSPCDSAWCKNQKCVPVTSSQRISAKQKERNKRKSKETSFVVHWLEPEPIWVYWLYCRPVCAHPLATARAPVYKTGKNMSTFRETMWCRCGMERYYAGAFSQKQPLEKNTKRTMCCSYANMNHVIGIYFTLLINTISYSVCHVARICFSTILEQWAADGPQGII